MLAAVLAWGSPTARYALNIQVCNHRCSILCPLYDLLHGLLCGPLHGLLCCPTVSCTAEQNEHAHTCRTYIHTSTTPTSEGGHQRGLDHQIVTAQGHRNCVYGVVERHVILEVVPYAGMEARTIAHACIMARACATAHAPGHHTMLATKYMWQVSSCALLIRRHPSAAQ